MKELKLGFTQPSLSIYSEDWRKAGESLLASHWKEIELPSSGLDYSWITLACLLERRPGNTHLGESYGIQFILQ